jgi:hypothetical protein
LANVSVFGYLISGSLDIQSLELSELTVAASIVGIGATRQARSHIKASIGVGNTPTVVADVVKIAEEVALWNKTPLPTTINVAELAEEISNNLKAKS